MSRERYYAPHIENPISEDQDPDSDYLDEFKGSFGLGEESDGIFEESKKPKEMVKSLVLPTQENSDEQYRIKAEYR